MGSSQIIIEQHPQPPSTSVSTEISIENLVKSWKRRQRWQLFFGLTEQSCRNRVPWRTHLVNFLESTPVHIFAISLLLVDLVIVILELSSNLVLCTTKNKNKRVQEVWYHWVGIGILTTLSAKSVALAVGLKSSFFNRPGYIVDGVVVTGALLLEVVLEREGGGLLVVASLWRVLRVVESAFELSDEAIEAQIKNIVLQFESLQEENGKLLGIISEKDKIIEELQEELKRCL